MVINHDTSQSARGTTAQSRDDLQGVGLKAIRSACLALYPNQPLPLQVTAVCKFWKGGPDPLDFINMYANPGSENSPPHWHYVTNGLSDLYGDARLHAQCASSPEDPSGFGFELTLRVRRHDEQRPPTWPAHLLQSLARYVFYSRAHLAPGDHIPWPCALDEQQTDQSSTSPALLQAASLLASAGHSDWAAALTRAAASKASSHIRHMLLVQDKQLDRISTPLGYVQFLQLVGLCDEELRLVQRWTGPAVADLLKQLPSTGGDLLVTDMQRNRNLFDFHQGLDSFVAGRMQREGSNLSGVTVEFFAWAPITSGQLGESLIGGERQMDTAGGGRDGGTLVSATSSSSTLLLGVRPRKSRLREEDNDDDDEYIDVVGVSGPNSDVGMESADSNQVTTTAQVQPVTPASDGSAPCTPLAHLSLSPNALDQIPIQPIDCLDLHLSTEAGSMLPLAISNRLRHGRHFTFLHARQPDNAVTLVPESASGAFVNLSQPYAARGPWLQLLLPGAFLDTLERDFSSLSTPPTDRHQPLVFRWPNRRLRLCIVDSMTTTVDSSIKHQPDLDPAKPTTRHYSTGATNSLGPASSSSSSPLLTPSSFHYPSQTGLNQSAPNQQQQPSEWYQQLLAASLKVIPPSSWPSINTTATNSNPQLDLFQSMFNAMQQAMAGIATPAPSNSDNTRNSGSQRSDKS